MNWIESKVRSASISRMFLAAAVIVVVIITLAANARYFSNFFKGPYAIAPAEMAAASGAEDLKRYWVNLKADELFDSGYQEITVRKKHGVERSREISANYHVALLGDRLLLVKAHKDTPTTSLTGYLKPISGKVDQSFFDDPKVAKHRDRFYPMMLDTADFKGDGEIGLIVASLLILAAIVYGAIAFGRFRNPASHPLFKSTASWGEPDEVSAMLKTELDSGKTLKFGGYVFTPNFVVRDQQLNFDVQRLDDLLWVYKQVVQKKIYYVIPAGKTFSVCLNWMKQSIPISGKEENVDTVLHYLANHKPWILLGHSDELAKAYKKKRSEIAEVVAQRRREVAQATQEGTPA